MANILVVDDSETVAEMLQVVLNLHDHDTKIVTGNFENLLRPDNAIWKGLDVLICDLMLGHAYLDGCDILRVAREYHPNIKRIVLSAAGGFLHSKYDMNTLADVVLDKPAHVTSILDML